MHEILRYVEANRERFIRELVEWVRIPSVSTLREYRNPCREAASWLANRLSELGLETRLVETAANPIVEASTARSAERPTVMIYGHYDVQPADPLGEWRHDPFEGVIEGENLVARGASDDKGQVMIHIAALEAWLKIGRRPLANVVFAVEGNEESGDPVMEKYAETCARKLRPEAILVSDTSQLAPGRPAITYALRGIVYLGCDLRTARSDLHSGSHGGPAPNAAKTLAGILAGLLNADGSVNVPDFYRDVRDLDADERKAFSALGIDDEEYARSIGVRGFDGEDRYSVLERRWSRPTLDINGIWAGFTGEGAKTVIPAEAHAKLSTRLVPDQDPAHIAECVEAAIRKAAPSYCDVSVKVMAKSPSLLVSRDSRYVSAAGRAIQKGFGVEPAYVRAGGSIPVLGALARATGGAIVMIGFSRPDDGAHAPNEYFNLSDFRQGIRSMACYWDEIDRANQKRKAGEGT